MLHPGPGVGGHCIPKDSWLLVSRFPEAQLIPAARLVNEAMPESVAALISEALQSVGQSIVGATIVVLGAAYRENVAETVNAPAFRLHGLLEEGGAKVRLHDPFVGDLRGIRIWKDLDEASKDADCLVLVTPHDLYREVDWETVSKRMRHPLLVDTRGFFTPREVRVWGFSYRGVGRGGPGYLSSTGIPLR